LPPSLPYEGDDCVVIGLAYQSDPGNFFSWLNQFAHPVWLDSGGGQTSGRFDIISARPSSRFIEQQGRGLLIDESGQQLDALDVLTQLKARLTNQCELDWLPFTEGAIGYVAYDYGLKLQSIPSQNPAVTNLPDIHFAWYDWSITLDHQEKKAYLFYRKGKLDDAWLTQIKKHWNEPKSIKKPFKLTKPYESLISRDAYGEAYRQIKHHLAHGDCYQVNLAHCFQGSYEGDSLTAYRHIRTINPVPFAAYLKLTDAEVLSFSPELFFQAKKTRVTTKPIKGTARVLANAEQDFLQQQSLLNSEKDRAENLMIVDLLRNDLSKLAKPHSVIVEKFAALETFRGVHHLVSTIHSDIDHHTSHIDLFKTLFPGGSITGAPKHEAMCIIDRLEVVRRHVYCGSIGYFSNNGNSLLNITIRTQMCENNQIYCYAGGGIVIDSKEEAEYMETLDKVRVLTQAF